MVMSRIQRYISLIFDKPYRRDTIWTLTGFLTVVCPCFVILEATACWKYKYFDHNDKTHLPPHLSSEKLIASRLLVIRQSID